MEEGLIQHEYRNARSADEAIRAAAVLANSLKKLVGAA
jgi:hypothetical protein